jgi:two-component system OmpR family response regulator
MAASFRPDLLVLDVMMPGLDGFGVVRRLRESGRHTPVLFLTARDAAEDKVSGLTLGGDDYVTKPFSLDEVLARIRAVLRRSTGPQRPAESPGCPSPTSSWTRSRTRSSRPARSSASRRRSSSCCAT